MAERDGTIVIDTQIDTKGVDAGSEKTEASLRRMAQKVNDIGATAKAALNKQIDAFARLNSQYDSQSEKIDALKRKIAGYSDEYGEMQAKIDETVKKLNDLEMMQAMKNGLIERNPVKLAELPRQTGTKKERTAMTKEQQDLFMKYAEESYLYHFFSVMLRTGMRKGEMQGLKYSDIDKKQNVIHVRRTLKYIEGKGYFEDTPKTRTSTRDIPLTAAITEHIEAQRKYWGFKVVRMDQYLFCNENGDPISRERIQGEIDRIIKRIKSDGYDFPRITSHVFRHTFATRAIEAGMPPQVLKTILGHSSLAMTMDLYSHVLPDTKADEMQKIANVF